MAHIHTRTHVSCSTLPEFTPEKGGNRLMYVSELSQSGEEGSDFPLFGVSV